MQAQAKATVRKLSLRTPLADRWLIRNSMFTHNFHYLIILCLTDKQTETYKEKRRGNSWFYFSLALMRISIAINRKVKPAMPLTSLGESIMLSGLKVVSTASPNKIAANIKTSNPSTIFSVFMNCCFDDVTF